MIRTAHFARRLWLAVRIPWITIVGAMLAWSIAHFGWESALQYQRDAILSGQWWRLWTAHFVHFDNNHLTWDLWIWVMFGATAEQFGRKRTLLTLLCAASVISLAVFVMQPELLVYRGLSGLDSALFGLLAGRQFSNAWRRRDCATLAVVAAVILLFLGKCGWESSSDRTVFVENTLFIPVPVAHLLGALAGLAGAWIGPSKRSRTSAAIDYSNQAPPLRPERV